MKLRKISYIPILLTCLTVVSLAGSSLGTLAWYAYSTRAKIEMGGTAVQSTEQLQIGLEIQNFGEHEFQYRNAFGEGNEYGTTLISLNTKWYIWMPAGQGFTAGAMNKFLQINGCATDSLTPTTTRDFVRSSPIRDAGDGNKLLLYDSLTGGDPVNEFPARAGSYIELPLAFRVLSYEGLSSSYASGKPIWITDITSASYDTKDADKALRVHVHNPTGVSGKTDFLINPAHQEDKDHLVDDANEFTYVAGCLNLKNTGYYDVDATGKEILYGDWEDGSINTTVFAADQTLASSNLNYDTTRGETVPTEATTFIGQHREGTTGYLNYKDASTLKDLRKKATYYTLYDIAPEVDGQGDYVNGYPVATTVSSATPDYRIARTDLTIWLEGWDHHIVDANIETHFSLGLQFEINRV